MFFDKINIFLLPLVLSCYCFAASDEKIEGHIHRSLISMDDVFIDNVFDDNKKKTIFTENIKIGVDIPISKLLYIGNTLSRKFGFCRLLTKDITHNVEKIKEEYSLYKSSNEIRCGVYKRIKKFQVSIGGAIENYYIKLNHYSIATNHQYTDISMYGWAQSIIIRTVFADKKFLFMTGYRLSRVKVETAYKRVPTLDEIDKDQAYQDVEIFESGKLLAKYKANIMINIDISIGIALYREIFVKTECSFNILEGKIREIFTSETFSLGICATWTV